MVSVPSMEMLQVLAILVQAIVIKLSAKKNYTIFGVGPEMKFPVWKKSVPD